uniref:Uncharacterized protein n=1 Tax=Quercus lobata TaxID=97700 RepID=A0A7N2LPX0_QUELO
MTRFQAVRPVFAVVQIGSHQFKLSNGDSIFIERLKFCEVNVMVTRSEDDSDQIIQARHYYTQAVVDG